MIPVLHYHVHYFQTDSSTFTSASFGKFEVEFLSWERKSSFSHNRYLEEVEKCLSPGSVIEKKAYFEAHFKKTALRNLIAIERQTLALEAKDTSIDRLHLSMYDGSPNDVQHEITEEHILPSAFPSGSDMMPMITDIKDKTTKYVEHADCKATVTSTKSSTVKKFHFSRTMKASHPVRLPCIVYLLLFSSCGLS